MSAELEPVRLLLLRRGTCGRAEMLPGIGVTTPTAGQARPSMLTVPLAAHLSDPCAAPEAISPPQKGMLSGLTLPFQAAGT